VTLRSWAGTARVIAIAAAVLAYALLSHYSNAAVDAHALGAVLAVTPLFLLLLMALWRATRWLTLPLGLAAAGLLYHYRLVLEHDFAWLYLLQQCGTYALLSYGFGRTLRAGDTPLCTRMAVAVHGELPPTVRRYARAVTLAWTIFFAGLTLALLVLFRLTSLRVWSIFANFCTLPLVAAMFIAELLVRRAVLPAAMKHSSIRDTVRAWLRHSRGTASPLR
jgi:uncharacterized membrane protein